MKKTLVSLALVAMCSMAFASDDGNPCGNNGNNCQTGGAGGTAVAGAAAGAIAVGGSVGNVTGVTGGIKAEGGSASLGMMNSFGGQGGSVLGSGNSANSNKNTNLNANIGVNKNTNTNLVSTKGTVGNIANTNGSSSSTSGNTNTSTGNAVSVTTVDPNSLAVANVVAKAATDVATINAKAATDAATAGTRDLTDQAIAAGHDQAARDVANTMKPINNTPSMILGQLATSNDTCMGSVTVGGSGPGFSIGVGSTYTDKNCVMLKNSRELWNRGYTAASMALLCKDADNKEALELTGYTCPVKVSTAPAPQPTEAGQ